MTTTIKTEFVGQVGVTPRLIRVQTTDNQASVETAGWINQFEAASSVNIEPSDFVFVTYNGGIGLYRAVFAPGGEITLTAIAGGGGGGGGLDQIDTYFVSKAGDDANDGKSAGSPKLTVGAAIAAIETPANSNVIIIQDGGTYQENLVIDPGYNIQISGPNARVEANTAGTATLTNNGEARIRLNELFNTAGGPSISNTTILELEINHLSGDIESTGNVVQTQITMLNVNLFTGTYIPNGSELRGYVDIWDGDFTGVGVANNATRIFFNRITGDITLTNNAASLIGNQIGGNITLSETGANLTQLTGYIANVPAGFVLDQGGVNIPPKGRFGGVLYGVESATIEGDLTVNGNILMGGSGNIQDETYPRLTISNDFTFRTQDSNRLIILQSLTNRELYAPDVVTNPDIAPGYRTYVLQESSGNGRINVMGSDILESVSGRRWTEGRGAISQLTLVRETGGIRTWSWAGNIAGSSTSSFVYVDQTEGDDSTAIGTESQPFATIQAAVNFAEAGGAPAIPTFIRVIDGAVYNEAITISQPNVNLLAPTATIVQTGANDCITFNLAAPASVFMNLGVVQNTGTGKAITCAGQEQILCNAAGLISSTDVISMSATSAFNVRSSILSGDIIGAGSVFYSVTTRQGADSTNSKGSSIDSIHTQNLQISDFNPGSTTTVEVGGDDGTKGDLVLYPSSASTGSWKFSGAVNSGDFQLILTHDPMPLNRTVTLPAGPSDYWLMGFKSAFSPDLGSNIITVDTFIPFSALSGGASLSVFFATSGAQYIIREIYMNNDGTNFSGGDRNIELFSSANIYTNIPNAALGAMTNARWGSTEVPFPVSIPTNEPTPASLNLAARYEGGTADHTAGTLSLSVVYERIA